MEITGEEVYTLLDYSKQFENGEELVVAEVLTKANPMLQDGVVIESNSDAGHVHSIRTGLPKGTWRRAYKGVPYAKGTQRTVTDTYGVLAQNIIVDKLIAEKGGNIGAVRMGQFKSTVEGMSQTMGETLIYGSQKKEEEAFTGLASRYAEASANWDEESSSRNVVLAGEGAANANTSIYLVTWAPDKTFMFFPKGSKAGIQRIDLTPNGKPHNVADGKGDRYPAYEEYVEWKLGLGISDWRYSGRLANITASTTGAELRAGLDELMARVDLGMGNSVLYMNKQTRFKLQQALDNKGNVFYTPAQPNQPAVLNYNGLPVHVCDFIKNTEAIVPTI